MPEDITSRRWSKTLIEVATIVGSILLAFAIDAWWDGARERETTTEMLRGIGVELNASLEQLEADIEWLERSGAVLASWPEWSPQRLQQATPDDLPWPAGVLNRRTAEPQLTQARVATSDGSLRSAAAEIQDLIVEISYRIDDMAEDRAMYMASHTALWDRLTELELIDDVVETCRADQPSTCRLILVEAAGDRTFRQLAARKGFTTRSYASELSELRDAMERLDRALIESTS